MLISIGLHFLYTRYNTATRCGWSAPGSYYLRSISGDVRAEHSQRKGTIDDSTVIMIVTFLFTRISMAKSGHAVRPFPSSSKSVSLQHVGTIFVGELNEKVWGKAVKRPRSFQTTLSSSMTLPFAIEGFFFNFVLRPTTEISISNHANEIRLNKDIPRIITDILQNNASLAIVSRNTSKALCDRALYYFKAVDPKAGEQKSIIKLVRYDEVVDEPITEHFKRIHGWSKFDFGDMVSRLYHDIANQPDYHTQILFDDDSGSNFVQTELGITVHNCKSQEGLTWETYSAGIENWRCNQTSSPPKASTLLGIAHFNDVYQVSNQKIKVLDQDEKKEETINVMKFATSLSNITRKWADRGDGGKDGLVIFSGDLFSPSTESSVTRGGTCLHNSKATMNSILVRIVDTGPRLGVCELIRNNLGYPQLDVLIKDTNLYVPSSS
ncbi:Metallo-dependent phosphatase [Salix suchowensis]|nr:Metallo-dependent phosphatase [Salix suchowensis]